MQFKTKNKTLIAQGKKTTVEFGEKLKIGDFTISGPGENEVGGVLVFAPEDNIFSIRIDGFHIVYWRAVNGQPKVESEALGDIDAMVLELGENTSSLKDVAATINNLEPADIILATPTLKDELIKNETLPTKEVETWKMSQETQEKDRELILLPCSQNS